MSGNKVKNLNENRDEALTNLKYIHEVLSKMVSYSKYCYNILDSDIHEVFEYPTLIKQKWGSSILSEKTFKLLQLFNKSWLSYRINRSFGDDPVFVYFDPEWHELIKEKLIPCLESMERDFELNKINYCSYKIYYNPENRPNEQDILERAQTLYNSLLNHKVFRKLYLNIEQE